MSAVMQSSAWRRIKWTQASQIAGLAGVAEALAGRETATPAAAFTALRAADPTAAANFMAQCLPRLDAVRWLHECLARTPPPPPGSNRADLRSAISAWLIDPSDKRRRIVYEHAELDGFESPESMSGLAVFCSGGGLGPAHLDQATQPPPGMFGKAVAGAVLFAAHSRGPEFFTVGMAALLDIAVAIAEMEPSA
jgi:hypothetical protein